MSSDREKYMGPESESVEASMKSSGRVKVFTHKRRVLLRMASLFIGFEPTGGDTNPVKGIGLIYYPGGNVRPDQYAPMARALAELGYHVAICFFPFELAVTNSERADDVLRFEPWKGVIKRWVIAGHSLGGVMAASYAHTNANDTNRFGDVPLSGVALHASFPQERRSMRGLGLKIYSIYAELDGRTTLEDIETSRKVLPEDTTFIRIEGGNHTQYYYSNDLQRGDNEATISLDEQQIEIRKATHKLLMEAESS